MAKRSPKLLFTDEERQQPELKKAAKKADRANASLEKAEANLVLVYKCGPVSYTHLDVYKRQDMRIRLGLSNVRFQFLFFVGMGKVL